MEAGAAATAASSAALATKNTSNTVNNNSKNSNIENPNCNKNNNNDNIIQSNNSLYLKYYTTSVVFKEENIQSSQNKNNNNNNSRSVISKLNLIENQNTNKNIENNNKSRLNLNKLDDKSLLKQKQLRAELLFPEFEKINKINKINKLHHHHQHQQINLIDLHLKKTSNTRVSSGKTSKTRNSETETTKDQPRVNAILVDLNQQSLDAMTILSSETQKNICYQILKRQQNNTINNNNNLFATNSSITSNSNKIVNPNKTAYSNNSNNSNSNNSSNLNDSSINSFHRSSSITSSSTNSHNSNSFSNASLLGEIKDNLLKRHKNSLINRLGLQVVEGARLNIKELKEQQSIYSSNSSLTKEAVTKCCLKIKDYDTNAISKLDKNKRKQNQLSDVENFQTQFRLKPLKLKNIELNDESLINLKTKYKEKIDECNKNNKNNLYNPNNLTSFNYPTNPYTSNSIYNQTPRTRLPKLPDCFGSSEMKSNKSSSDSSENQKVKEKLSILSNQTHNSTISLLSNNSINNNNSSNSSNNSSRSKITIQSNQQRSVNFKNKLDQPMNVIRASNSSGFDINHFIRVESPHKLEKSVPDDYKFYGNSSMYVNKAWFNQQFEMYQSDYYDDANSNSNSS